ncbi:MAG: hypothetical protein ACR2J8_10985 [Thermomicrobiales bacterium]
MSVSEGMDMKGIALGLAVAGVAAFGFAGVAAAAESPSEVGAVTTFCIDLGYDSHDCQHAVKDAIAGEVVAATNANLAAQGIDHVVVLGI